MQLPSASVRITAVVLRRLAHACEAYLGDNTLAEQLRAVAAQEEADGGSEALSLPDAVALAGSLERYLGLLNEPSVSPHDREQGAPLRDLLAGAALKLGARLRQVNVTKMRGLSVIVDPTLTGGRDVLAVAQAALEGGATAIQLRDKIHDKGDVLPLARQLTELCQRYGAACIINDHADLAVACGAHGLHLGQHDLPLAEARRVLHPWQFVGRSNALLEEAQRSYQEGADYIAVGAMFPSGSKEKTRPAGPETLHRVRQAIPADGPPLVAIGGITHDNVAQVIQAGADGVCVIGAVALAPDPTQAARTLLERIQAARA